MEVTEVERPCQNCNSFNCNCNQEIEDYNNRLRVLFQYKQFKIKLSPQFAKRHILGILLLILISLLFFMVCTVALDLAVQLLVAETEYRNLNVLLGLGAGYIAFKFFLAGTRTMERTLREIKDLFIFERN